MSACFGYVCCCKRFLRPVLKRNFEIIRRQCIGLDITGMLNRTNLILAEELSLSFCFFHAHFLASKPPRFQTCHVIRKGSVINQCWEFLEGLVDIGKQLACHALVLFLKSCVPLSASSFSLFSRMKLTPEGCLKRPEGYRILMKLFELLVLIL